MSERDKGAARGAIRVERAFGPVVEGEAVVSEEGFSPRYDGQDRWLRRCFAVADIRAARSQLRPASRVHRALEVAA